MNNDEAASGRPGLVLLAALALVGLGTGSALADAMQWGSEDGGNGHWYEVVEDELSWFEASDLATARGGYLVTVTSAGENQLLCDAGFPDTAGRPYWTGGTRQSGSWTWHNGESWGYSNWDGIEPNGCCGYGGYGADFMVWRPWHNVAICGWDDTNPFHCSDDPGCTPRTLIEFSADCNGDGIVDYGQILDGSLADADGNGVPDCCDQGEPCNEPVSNHVLELSAWPDVAVIPHHQSVNPLDAMTIEFWIKTNGSNGDGRPITKRPGNGGCYTIDANPGSDTCVTGASVFGSCNGAHWGEIPCDWVHLALTVDGATGIARAYRNGELVSEHDQDGACTIGQGSWDLRFGNTNGFSTTQFIGQLDNIRIWNVPLDEDQVRHWMNTGITPEMAATMPELGGSWNFEDGVTDATGVNDGWLEAGAAIVPSDPIVSPDCDGDGVSDAQELAEGSSDYDADGVPDECQCLADLDGDEVVSVNDLLVVIAQWGSITSLGDINNDDMTNVDDLLLVIQSWGACP